MNDAPVAVNDNYTVAEEGTVTLNPLALDTDLDGDTLSITSINGTTLTPGTAQAIPVTNGTINITAAGVITFTPAANFNSATAVSIPYVITDGTTTATANELITVSPVNDAPVAVNDTNTIIPSTAVATAINALVATDLDGTIANYTILSLPANGILALSGMAVTINQILTPVQAAMLTYDPSGAFTGNDSFVFTATDNEGALDVSPATIVIPVGNNAPVADDNTNAGISSVAEATLIAPLTATDTDGTIVSYTILSLPANGVLALSGGAVTINQILSPVQVAMLTYDPSGAFTGEVSFTFTATDNNGSLDLTPATIKIVVNPSIDATNDVLPVSVAGGVVTTIPSLFANDTVNGNPFTPSQVTLSTLPIGGGILMNADGTITVPANAPSGSYPVTYTICTVATPSVCDTATTTVVVNPSIDATNDVLPVSVAGGVVTTIPSLFANDTVNGNPFTPSQVTLSTLPIGGGILMNADGTITVPANAPSGSYPVTYTICTVATPSVCDTATTTVVVNPSIDAINDVTTTVPAGVVTVLPTLYANDNVNGNPFTLSQITLTVLQPIGGGIVMNADGTVTVPANAPSGSYAVNYRICTVATPVVCDTATKTIIVDEKPSIAIIKTATFNDENADGYAQAGETISYVFAITNTGNVALSNVTVEDNYLPDVILAGSPITSLGIGETNSNAYTATYAIKQNDINIGSIKNQAMVTATSLNGTIVTDLSDNTNILDDKPTVMGVSGCLIEVFNAVSPNGDGDNDVFYIRGLECYPKNTVEIYNRWGVLVFERSGYNNSDRAFKGVSEGRVTVNQSEELPEGTYYYILRYEDSASTGHEKAGYLYINR